MKKIISTSNKITNATKIINSDNIADNIKATKLLKVEPVIDKDNIVSSQDIFKAGDTLFGKTNIPTEFVLYTGGTTDTAEVIVDNSKRIITANVISFSVEDVKVDNVSVVSNKIAYIELQPIRNLIDAETARAIAKETEIDDKRVHNVELSGLPNTEKLKIVLKDKNNNLIATDDIDLGTIVSGIIKVELKTDAGGFYLLFTKGNGTEIKCYLNTLVADYESKILAESSRAQIAEQALNNSINAEVIRATAKENSLEEIIPVINTESKQYQFSIRLQNGKPQLVYKEI